MGCCNFKTILNRISGRLTEKARLLNDLSVDFHPVDVNEAEILSQTMAENNCVSRFKVFVNGLNYHPHSTSCTCEAVLKGNVLQTLMRTRISASKHVSSKHVKAVITGFSSKIPLANFPSI